MHRSETRILVLDERAPVHDDRPSLRDLPDALMPEIARVRPSATADSLRAVSEALREVVEIASAQDLAETHLDASIARAATAVADWVREIVLDADVLPARSAAERAVRDEVVMYADLHRRAFVGPSLADARQILAESLDPSTAELLAALEILDAAVAAAAAALHDGSAPTSVAA